jgi:hypothetical protein
MVPGNASSVNSILREHQVRYESSVKMQFAGSALRGRGLYLEPAGRDAGSTWSTAG